MKLGKSFIPAENTACYQTKEQKSVLKELAELKIIHENFFLTGGTALSVFYLHHRSSEDLDLFSIKHPGIGVVHEGLVNEFGKHMNLIKSSPNFLSCLIHGVKVDIVIDPLSQKVDRPIVELNEGNSIMIDVLDNIAANKLTTLVSRFEIKDMIDFFFISKEYWDHSEANFDNCYELARQKEALLDDYAQTAFQIEETMKFVAPQLEIIEPLLKKRLDWNEMEAVFKSYVRRIYKLQKWG